MEGPCAPVRRVDAKLLNPLCVYMHVCMQISRGRNPHLPRPLNSFGRLVGQLFPNQGPIDESLGIPANVFSLCVFVGRNYVRGAPRYTTAEHEYGIVIAVGNYGYVVVSRS